MLRKNNTPHEKQVVCCVCHNGDEKEGFVVACKCSGSMKYHEDCIKKSIIQRKTVKCPNCGTDYYGAFVNNLKDFTTGYVVNLYKFELENVSHHVSPDKMIRFLIIPFVPQTYELEGRITKK